MPAKRKKRFTYVAFLLIAIGGAAGIAASFRARPVPSQLEQVRFGPLKVAIDGTGRTRMTERYTLFAPAIGRLERIALRPGDPVAEGAVLARVEPGLPQPLDPRSRAELSARVAAYRAALAEAGRNLERAELAAALATSESERAKRLVEAESAPARTFEVAEAERKARTSEIAMAKEGMERVRLEAEAMAAMLRPPEKRGAGGKNQEARVLSPISGVVLRVLQESAGPVQPGTPLIEIGNPARLELVIDLPTPSAVRIRPGAEAEVDGLGTDRPLKGRVRLVEPSAFTKISALGVEEQRVNVLLDPVGDAETWRTLGDGYAAEVRITVHAAARVLKAPTAAVFRDGSAFAVFAVEDGRARLKRVDVGERNATEVEIRGGLAEGQTVIVHPSDKVKDNAPIEPE